MFWKWLVLPQAVCHWSMTALILLTNNYIPWLSLACAVVATLVACALGDWERERKAKKQQVEKKYWEITPQQLQDWARYTPANKLLMGLGQALMQPTYNHPGQTPVQYTGSQATPTPNPIYSYSPAKWNSLLLTNLSRGVVTGTSTDTKKSQFETELLAYKQRVCPHVLQWEADVATHATKYYHLDGVTINITTVFDYLYADNYEALYNVIATWLQQVCPETRQVALPEDSLDEWLVGVPVDGWRGD